MIFEIDNIELYFSEKQILNGVYLKAETGKITGILGSNGCGKSSLLKIFFGSFKPRHKLIRIDGKPFLAPFFTSGMVKLLPQHHFLPPNLSLSTIFKAYAVSWKNFTEAFPAFFKFEKIKSSALSGGELRLVETFLILKSNSKIVLLDEPFSHLSPVYVEKICEMLLQEKQNKAIVVTDHLYRYILEVTDNLYLLKNGCTQCISDFKQLEDYKYLKSLNF